MRSSRVVKRIFLVGLMVYAIKPFYFVVGKKELTFEEKISNFFNNIIEMFVAICNRRDLQFIQ